MTSITIDFPDELPIGRKNSFLKGIIDGLTKVAESDSPLSHTPDGHSLYRAMGTPVATQIVDAAKEVTKKG